MTASSTLAPMPNILSAVRIVEIVPLKFYHYSTSDLYEGRWRVHFKNDGGEDWETVITEWLQTNINTPFGIDNTTMTPKVIFLSEEDAILCYLRFR